ncbi:MAG: SOS response-associated peptidase [Solirubrobacteraceae bacterium]
MCGRYTLATVDPADLRARFPIAEGIEIRRRYNVAPGDNVLAVTTDRAGDPRLEALRWGLVPSWADKPGAAGKLINARAETVAERPAFRTAFASWRCLVPADGFYEWRRAPDGRKEAFHITRADGGLFAFAGLWSKWRGPQSEESSVENTIRSCAIVTTAANSAVAPLHDRMPVILPTEAEAIWLDSGTPRSHLSALLEPLSDAETVIRAVGPAVNDVRYDGPECLAPPSPPPPRQAALF